MRFLLTFWMIVAGSLAGAADLSALKAPGVVALMRHALAPGTGDPAAFRLRDCATQRNLDARGRAQAQETGAALRAAGVTFDHVWSSRWCRALDTAAFMEMGTVVEQPPLDSFYAGQGDPEGQTKATLEMIETLPEAARVLIVTHQVNITALTGLGVGSGEIIVTRRGAKGLIPVGRYMIAP
ncbi:histidine phosphatase family protein [Roseovarius mucosus]|uniref:histidine phosphatase family protein n=1 Tax=Roseovarius mucosus TaxID=215743 RepID=UPI001C5F6F63|nr:histidine phosphatase family protein [Roseovarius mucosus]MBW4972054.1 histidine phosphatase family protein [Roseovarius mucosus]